MPLSGEWLS